MTSFVCVLVTPLMDKKQLAVKILTKDLLDSAFQCLCHWPLSHCASNFDDVINSQIARMFYCKQRVRLINRIKHFYFIQTTTMHSWEIFPGKCQREWFCNTNHAAWKRTLMLQNYRQALWKYPPTLKYVGISAFSQCSRFVHP